MNRRSNPQFLAAYELRQRHPSPQVHRVANPARPHSIIDPERAFVIAKRLERLERMDTRGRTRLAQRDRLDYQRMAEGLAPVLQDSKKNTRRRQQEQEQQQNTQSVLVQALNSMRIDSRASKRRVHVPAQPTVAQLTQLAQRDRRDYERMKRVLLADVRVKAWQPHAKNSRDREVQLPQKGNKKNKK